MTFSIGDAERVRRKLRRAAPTFAPKGSDGADERFAWTRNDPKDHWSPLWPFTRRPILGSLRVGPRPLVAEAQTLSMAARLADTVRRLLGEAAWLEQARWTEPPALRPHDT
ncbi:MAG: hypothetical protein ACYCWW_00705 [Deltaproteobacteria bacterium]